MASNDLFFEENEVKDFSTNFDQPETEFWDRTQNELDQLERDFPDAVMINDSDITNGPSTQSLDADNELISTHPKENNIDNEDKLSDKSQSSKYSAIAKADHVYKEPEKIKLWREKQQEMLKVKDQEEQVKQKEMKEAAKKELEEWEQRYKEQISKAKENNRLHEKEIVESRDTYNPEKEWEKIASLCDFNPKNSKHTKDVTRLRSIILKLKSSPIVVQQGNNNPKPSSNKKSNLPNGHLEEEGDST